MSAVMHQADGGPALRYHVLRAALERFSRGPAELAPEEYAQVCRTANRSYELESLVLSSSEAKGTIIPDGQVESALATVASRYAGTDEFLVDLERNGLDRDGLRDALHRELLFDSVMQRVAARGAAINEIDVRLFYEMHRDRFETPEVRVARHILITINPDYVENTAVAAMSRMQEVERKLAGRASRFADLAGRYSECPSAMEGGRLGDIRRGVLYPELDAALFRMAQGGLSPIIETEAGLHILYCEKIRPAKRVPFSKAAPRARAVLEQRRRRNCQKAWLSELRSGDRS